MGPILLSFVLLSAKPTILIAGGDVIDGTGSRRHMVDVRVQGDTIVAVGHLRRQPGERVINAKGLVVAPGFIDAHSHVDGWLLSDPVAESQIRQGITTSVIGQDGGSHYPIREMFAQYAARHVALNIASYVGHGTIRSKVMGRKNKRLATPDEVRRMANLVGKEVEDGALGISTGLEYEPGRFSNTAELVALGRAAGRHGGIYISHMRNEDNEVLQAIDELFTIAREGHLGAQISHIKIGSARVWGKAPEILSKMKSAEKNGIYITADVYPYTYWQSTIRVLIPTQDYGDKKLWEQGLKDVGGPDHVLLGNYGPDPTWKGKTIGEISRATGKDPVSVCQEIVSATSGSKKAEGESVVVTAMSDADLDKFIASPRIMFCTDGQKGGAHPRYAGSFPRILGVYVRQRHVLTLEEAIRKMTSFPAHRLGFLHRGAIKPGFKADIVVFDPKSVLDKATTKDPEAPPVGIDDVLVNGVLVLDNGVATRKTPGQVIKRTVRLR
ncbi:MAG: D-aminoacylase [Fimbriimonas sp.]|nr:D-aminoacylase [Fimbriimonas sp.]